MKDKKIKLVSNRQDCLKKARPVFWGIAYGYLMSLTIILTAIFTFKYNFYLPLALLITGIAFSLFLTFYIYRTIKEASCDYILEITGQDAIFTKIDSRNKKRTDQLLLLSDIKYVEYYPYQDSASIIFHTPYIDMDVPLWTMGEHVQDVLDFLKGAGIKIINVESDEAIPN